MGCQPSKDQKKCVHDVQRAKYSTSEWWETQPGKSMTRDNNSFEDTHPLLTKDQKRLIRQSWKHLEPKATEVAKQVSFAVLKLVYFRSPLQLSSF